MPGNYSKVKTVVTGETITAVDRNSEHDNHIANADTDGIDDASANLALMQSVEDPYPAASESLATDLRGEIERLRYLIKQITGEAQWYIDPDASIATLNTIFFASGTSMIFFQAAAPTGWTQDATHNDKALRVVSGAGGGNGGTLATSAASVAGHAISSAEMPAHTHLSPLWSGGGGPSHLVTGSSTSGTQQSTNSAGSGGSHVHGLDLAYIDMIVADKD